jgi:hypothetical protein
MTPTAILDTCAARGIALRVTGDRLVYRAPLGALTRELRTALAEHKTELLAILGDSNAGVERVESGVLGASPSGFLRVLRHTHICPICCREFHCTAPSCAGQPKRCVCCALDAIEGRCRATRQAADRSR